MTDDRRQRLNPAGVAAIPVVTSSEPPPIPPPPGGRTNPLARARLLTEAAAEALKVADNYRALALGIDAFLEREIYRAKADGADAVMAHLIRLANEQPAAEMGA
jgi:hypothetical protein